MAKRITSKLQQPAQAGRSSPPRSSPTLRDLVEHGLIRLDSLERKHEREQASIEGLWTAMQEAEITAPGKYALHRAVDAATHVAKTVSPTPTQAAMEVMCAFLIAQEQLRRANKEAKPLTQDEQATKELADAMLKSVGFDGAQSAQTTRAMTLFGLPVLLRVRQPNLTDASARPDLPRRDGSLQAVWRWLARRSA